ncbi:MAG: hypothetical protein GY733_22800 [bacterium]|nr:hypothetical protein [bacterium]
MADWRIRKRYGRGAARVVLCPEPLREPAGDVSVLEGAREIGPELLRGAKSGVVFMLVIVAAFAFTALRERGDLSRTQMLVWNDPGPEPLVAQPEPAKPKPVIPKPLPPEPKIAEAKPPPPAKPKAKPKPLPAPKMERPPPQIAKAKPKPRAKPKIEMAALSTPKVQPVARHARQRVEVQKPDAHKVRPLPTPAMNALAVAPDTQTRSARTERVAGRASTRSKVVPALAISASQRPLVADRAPRSSRRAAPAFAAAKSKSRARVEVAAATSAIAVAAESESLPRSQRVSATPRSVPASLRSASDLGFSPAALAPAAPAPDTSAPAARVARTEAPSTRSRGNENANAVRGVPLGSLASCVSDRQEDLLKQQVLAAVGNREACVSSHGAYRFVETKNLNAFSMWIERANRRVASDRCVELKHALACLE